MADQTTLTADAWDSLLSRIKSGKCTPILGPEAERGMLPPRSEIARDLAKEFGYPFQDSDDLARVAQFLVTKRDPLVPREELSKLYEAVNPPDFTARDSVHGLLAGLPLPVYVTTAYDDYLMQALRVKLRDPKRELCRWNRHIEEESVFDKGFQPSVANPVVFYMHGHIEVAESMVITEDEYLDCIQPGRQDPGFWQQRSYGHPLGPRDKAECGKTATPK